MKYVVENIVVHLQEPSAQDALSPYRYFSDALLNVTQPCDVSWVKPMQRRRLSPFAKSALSAAYLSSSDTALPIVFSSRHGDLKKTSDLLNTLVEKQPLSPTLFGLSVHNAVIGLFSILTNNTQPINAVAAGRDSLSSAMLDALLLLQSNDYEQVLVVHCDQALNEPYLAFSDEPEIDHSIAFLMRKARSNETGFSMLPKGTPAPHMTQNSALHLACALANHTSAHVGSWQFTYG